MLRPGAVRVTAVALAVAVLVLGCAPASTQPAGQSDLAPTAPTRPKVITVAIPSEPSGLSDKLFQAASDVDSFFEADLAYLDDTDTPHPLLAERLPTQENGGLVVNPDGTMRSVYTLKPDLRWDDGEPLTADDFVFAHEVYTDEDIPVSKRLPEALMSRVIARDPRTVEILWREPYVGGGKLNNRELPPMPRHVLGDLWAQDKTGMLASSFWFSPDYVGSGPYKLATWEKGIGITFAANPNFALGRPGADTVRLLFVADANTVAARMFAGDIDVFPTATAANALTMKERWDVDGAGAVYIVSLKTRKLYFQFRDGVAGHQRAILDLRVRQALMHAVDRTAMATAIEGALGQVADTAYPRGSPLYPRIDEAIARYPFDRGRAQALLRDAGWTAAADGLVHDPSGRTLDMEVRTIEEQDATIMADYWKQTGINSQPRFVTGVERRNDEFRANFPATQLQSGSSGYLTILCTTCAPSPANRWTGSQNRGTYSNPEYDRLYALSFTTLDPAARDNVLVQTERLITQDLAVGYIIHDTAPLVARSNVRGIKNATKELGNSLWNLWEWTVEEGR
jgi:peptide/nickel transport system substrate-binding protein